MNSTQPLENYLVEEPERFKAICRIYGITNSWGLNLRNIDGIPVHFGLNRFYEIGETEFVIVNEEDNNYCGKFLFVFKGQTCPAHHHKKKHETFFIVKGKVRMVVNKKERILEQGQILVMERGDTHSFTGLTDALLLEVSNASTRGDSFFDNKQIGKKGVL